MNQQPRISFRFLGKIAATMLTAYVATAGSAAFARGLDWVDDGLVMTDKGPVQGIVEPTVKRYLGIPYAAAPAGDLRWQPPQPREPWSEPVFGQTFGARCQQVPSALAPPSPTSEDCLSLNVYTPNHDGQLRDLLHRHAVMIWIHGGALVTGQSGIYNPVKLVEQEDVIVVTINYRLGALGYLAHPALSAETDYQGSGNYGFMDQQAAVKWVKRNIRRFGGDPDRITIFGESAGGLSVHVHLASPEAAGLFDRAIVQSGAYELEPPTLEGAEAAGTAFAATAGCPDQTAECLRALPVAAILAAQDDAHPTIDGKILTQTMSAAFASGEFNQVPVIQGSNRDEWRLFVGLTELGRLAVGLGALTEPEYPGAVAGTLGVPPGPVLSAILAQYPLDNYRDEGDPEDAPSLALGAVGTDAIFACNSRRAAQLLSQHVRTYAYEFRDRNAPLLLPSFISFPQGAYHAAEIQYIITSDNPARALNAEQVELSDAMVSYWGKFARLGTPNWFGTPLWVRYGPERDNFQTFDPPTPGVTTAFAEEHKCDFWTPPAPDCPDCENAPGR